MCAEPIGEEHQHVVDLESRGLMCTCRACYLLFTARATPQLRYRAVPDRYLSFPDLAFGAGQWDELRDPGRAGVLLPQLRARTGRSRSTRARPAPPSPSCRWGLGPDRRRPTRAGHARARRRGAAGPRARPTASGRRVLPGADRRLLRAGRAAADVWRGFDGGQEARAAIDAFFADVAARSRPAPAARGRASMTDLAFAVARRRRRAVRGRAAPDWPGCGSRRRTGADGPRDRAALPGADRAAAPPLRRRRGATALLDLFGGRDRWPTTLKPFLWMQRRRRWSRASPAAPRSTCRCRAPTTSRSPRSKYLHALRRRRGPAVFLFSGTVFTRGDARLRRRAGAVGPARRATGCRSSVWRDLMDAATSRTPAGCACDRDTLDALAALQGRARADHVGRDRAARCCRRARRPVPSMTLDAGHAPSPTRCSTRATCSTRTAPPRARTRCAGSSASSARRSADGRAFGEEPDMAMQCLLRARRTSASPAPSTSTCGSSSCRSARPSAPRRTARTGRSTSSASAATRWMSWDEAVEVERALGALRAGPSAREPPEFVGRGAGGEDVEPVPTPAARLVGRLVRRRWRSGRAVAVDRRRADDGLLRG